MSSLSKNYVKEVCKIGQGAACCRYLGAGTNGLECLKLDIDFAPLVDKRTDMVAKGDNCEGVQS